jgi:transposase-like protein
MPRHAAPLKCAEDVRSRLLAISRSGSEEARMVERARIILACLEGKQIQQVARELGISVPTVGKWWRRFARHGLEGLASRGLTMPAFAIGS